MMWEWNGAEIVTTFVSLVLSSAIAAWIALRLQGREFDRQTQDRRLEQAEAHQAEERAWRARMADEAITFCISISESAMAPGDGYKSVMVERWLDAFQARLRLGGNAGADHIAVQMREDWKRATKLGGTVKYATDEREAAYRGVILQLQEDLRLWGTGRLETEFWARR